MEKKAYDLYHKLFFGAGSGNRTRIASLEGWNSTIELHLHSSKYLPLTSIDYKVGKHFCQ